jgi:drug/metabolite transporter (DMT)-like permease
MESIGSADRALKGAVFIGLSNVAFCAMACLVRYCANVNAFTSTMFRFVVGMAVIGALVASGRVHLTFVNKRGLFLRGLLGGVAIACGFISITKLGLVKASIIMAMYPVFATLFSVPMLGERLSFAKIVALAGAVAGVFVVLSGRGDPNALFSSFGFYEAMAIGGTVIAGLSVVLVKQLQETESTSTIYFSQCLVGFWMVIVPAGAAPLQIGYFGALLLIAIGLLAAAGQLIGTEGYRYVTVSTASIFVMASPIINIGAGALLFHESFTPWTATGGLITLVSCIGVVWGDRKKRV